MENTKLSLKKNLLWNSVGSFTYLICQWLLTYMVVLFSNNFENAGILSLCMTISNIFFIIAGFNVRPFLVSDIHNKYSSNTYSAFRLITCVISFIACFIYIQAFDYSMNQNICILVYMLYKICEAIIDLLHAFEQKQNRMDIGGISLMVRGILSLVSFTICLLITDRVDFSIISMVIVSLIEMAVFDFPQAVKYANIKPIIEFKKIKSLFLELIPLVLGSVMNTFSASFPRQILERDMGTNTLGIFATVAAPAVIVQVAATYIFTPMQVTFTDLANKRDKQGFMKLLHKTTFFVVGLSVICCLGAFIFGKWGLTILYGNKIAEYAYLLLPVVLFCSLNAYVWFFTDVLIVLRRLKTLMILNTGAMLISVTGSSLFMNWFGINGISYIMITYSILLIICMYTVITKTVENTF